jgi:catechol 2,3-dioxygenase-like lactoylglutathione lyase family enzyme
MANPFVHVELATTDLDKSKSFYQSLFSWQLQDVDMGGGMSYTMINVGEGTGGGMMKHPVPGAPSAWLAYSLVDDVVAQRPKQSRSAPRSCAMSPRCRTQVHSRSSSTRPARRWVSGSRRRSDREVAGRSVTVAAADGSGLEAYLAVPGPGSRPGLVLFPEG